MGSPVPALHLAAVVLLSLLASGQTQDISTSLGQLIGALTSPPPPSTSFSQPFTPSELSPPVSLSPPPSPTQDFSPPPEQSPPPPSLLSPPPSPLSPPPSPVQDAAPAVPEPSPPPPPSPSPPPDSPPPSSSPPPNSPPTSLSPPPAEQSPPPPPVASPPPTAMPPPPPPVIAAGAALLNGAPDPSGVERLNITLQLTGYSFLPYTNETDAALRDALQDNVNTTGFAVASTVALESSLTGLRRLMQSAAMPQQTAIVQVVGTVPSAQLQDFLGNLETAISLNQVSGSLRYHGLYLLQTVTIISIVRATGEVLVGSPLLAPLLAPGPVLIPANAPLLAVSPSLAPSTAQPILAPAPVSLPAEVPAPAPMPVAVSVPVPAPVPAVDILPSSVPSPAMQSPAALLPVEVPAPSLVSPLLPVEAQMPAPALFMPTVAAPAPEADAPGPALGTPLAGQPAPAPAPAPLSSPAAANMVLPAPAPLPQPNAALSMQPAPMPQPAQLLQPADIPSAPALLPSAGQQPVQAPSNPFLPSMRIPAALAPIRLQPSPQPARASAPRVPGPRALPPLAVPAPAPAVAQPINITLRLTGPTGQLNNASAAGISAALAGMTSPPLDSAQVLVLNNQPVSPAAATGGRKLLQASSNDVTLQITPNPDQADTVTQQLTALANGDSDASLIAALQQQGIDVSGAHIVQIGNQQFAIPPTISQPPASPAVSPPPTPVSSPPPVAASLPPPQPVAASPPPVPAQAPQSPIPIPSPQSGSSSSAGAIGGAIGGVVAAAALLVLAFCCWRRRRRNRGRKALEHRTKSFAMDAANDSVHGAKGMDGDAGDFKHYNSTYEAQPWSAGKPGFEEQEAMASPFMQPPSQPHSPLSSAQDAPLIKPNTPPSMDPFSLNSTVMQDVSQRRSETPRHMGSRRSAASSDFKLHWAPGVERRPMDANKDVNSDLAGIASAGISKLRSMSSVSKEQVATLSQKGTSRGDRSPRTQGSATAGTFDALMPAMGAQRTANVSGRDDAARQAANANVSNAVIEMLNRGDMYAGKYVLQQGNFRGQNAIEVTAVTRRTPERKVSCKFFATAADYHHESQLGEILPANGSALEVLDSYEQGEAPGGSGIPACIVTERGDYTLHHWLSNRSKMPEDAQQKALVRMLALAVKGLHERGVVHGALTPDACHWFGARNAIKLGGFGCWAMAGSPMPVRPALRYAPPELVMAEENGASTMAAHPAVDAWALGAIAYEIFAGKQLLGNSLSMAKVLGIYSSRGPLPWEEDAAQLNEIANPQARALVASLLRRRPEERASIDEILQSTMFGSKTGLQRRNTGMGSRELPRDSMLARANSGSVNFRSIASSPVAPIAEVVSSSHRQVTQTSSLTSHRLDI